MNTVPNTDLFGSESVYLSSLVFDTMSNKLRNQILDVFIIFAINAISALHSSKIAWKELFIFSLQGYCLYHYMGCGLSLWCIYLVLAVGLPAYVNKLEKIFLYGPKSIKLVILYLDCDRIMSFSHWKMLRSFV